MTGFEFAHAVRDSEQLGDEFLKRGRKLDDQFGFRLARDCLGRGTRGHQPVVQGDVTCLEERDEMPVEPHQSVAGVEVVECEAEAGGEALRHQQNKPSNVSEFAFARAAGNSTDRLRSTSPGIGNLLDD